MRKALLISMLGLAAAVFAAPAQAALQIEQFETTSSTSLAAEATPISTPTSSSVGPAARKSPRT